MSDIKRSSLVKPTFETNFHIDFDWWSQNDREWQVYLRSLLTEEEQEKFADVISGDGLLDWVDPETAEIQRVDGLQHVVITHAAQREDFLGEKTAMTEAIFRLFLKHGNTPMSISEIAEQLNRKPVMILKMLSGGRFYRGLRPILD